MGKVVEIATNENLIQLQEDYINRLYKNKDYEACYSSCDYLLSLLPKGKNEQKRLKQFCYKRQAVCLKSLGKYDESEEKANIALKYSNKDDYYSIIHLKAILHKKRGENDKAVSCLNRCIKWYRHNDMHYELGMVLDIKGDLIKNEDLLREALQEYQKAYDEGNYYDKDILIKEIDNVYERLVELYTYIGEQNMIKAYSALSNIQTEETKNRTRALIKNLYRKEV